MKDLIIVHTPDYANWIFEPGHPTQGRRFTNAHTATLMHADEAGLTVDTITPRPATRAELGLVHSPDYIASVLDQHTSGEWDGPRPDLSNLANLFAGGTFTALESLLANRALTAAHFPGAKHHAQRPYSSGFCVFADFAIAAFKATAAGLRVAILDIDAHHGDGTENLTYGNYDVLTFSVHQHGIFPYTGFNDDPDYNVFNYPLDSGEGDRSLRQAVFSFIQEANRFQPHLIFIAGGADGHITDPLSELRYTVEGYENAATLVRSAFPDKPILFGGAGGYQPDGATPLVWARMVTALAK